MAGKGPPDTSDRALPWYIGGETSRPALTAQRVVDAAHALVHAGGIDALTLRALARELDVGTSAIYRRIQDKEHLLVAIADLVLGEVPTDGSRPSARTWRASLRTLSFDLRDTLAAHPHIHPVLDSYLLVTPGTVRIAERAVAALRAAGFSGEAIVDAYNVWAGYVIGFSLIEMQPSQPRADRMRLRGWARPYLEGLDAAEFPALSEALPALENRAFAFRWEAGPLGVGAGSFGFGLEVLLSGLDGAAKARRPR